MRSPFILSQKRHFDNLTQNTQKKLSSFGFATEIPNLLDVQRESFYFFLKEGFKKAFSTSLKFSTPTDSIEIKFLYEMIQFQKPEFSEKQAFVLGKTFGSAVYIPVTITSKMSSKVQIEWLLIGVLPLMTKHGHFIINGIPRVVLHQMVRNPGIYTIPRDSRTQTATVRIVPERGGWINLTADKKNRLWFSTRSLRRKVSLIIFLQALGISPGQLFAELNHTEIISNSYVKDLTAIKRQQPSAQKRSNSKTFPSLVKNPIVPQNDILRNKAEGVEKGFESVSKQFYDFAKVSPQPEVLPQFEGFGKRKEKQVPKPGGFWKEENLLIGKTRHDKILIRAHLEGHPRTQAEAWRYLYAHFLEYAPYSQTDIVTNETAREFFWNTIWNNEKLVLGQIGRQQFRQKVGSKEPLQQISLTLKDLVRATQALLNLIYKETQGDEIDSLTQKRIRGCDEFLLDYLIRGIKEFDLFFTRKISSLPATKTTLSPLKNTSTPITKKGVILKSGGFENNESVLKPSGFEKSKGILKDVSNLPAVGKRKEDTQLEQLWRQNRSVFSKTITKSWKNFFTSGTLAQFMDQTNPLAEATHKRRLTVLGPGGVSSKQTTIQIRGIHPTYYGRLCPIETPEGQNAGLVSSFTVFATPSHETIGNITTPFYQVFKGQVQIELSPFRVRPEQEYNLISAPSDIRLTPWNVLPKIPIPVRKELNFDYESSSQITTQSVGILQSISVATSLIPFLEHDDANRALMGSNMQRQAVPLLQPEAPIVGTGLETRVVSDVNHVIQASQSGYLTKVTSKMIQTLSPKKPYFRPSRFSFFFSKLSSRNQVFVQNDNQHLILNKKLLFQKTVFFGTTISSQFFFSTKTSLELESCSFSNYLNLRTTFYSEKDKLKNSIKWKNHFSRINRTSPYNHQRQSTDLKESKMFQKENFINQGVLVPRLKFGKRLKEENFSLTNLNRLSTKLFFSLLIDDLSSEYNSKFKLKKETKNNQVPKTGALSSKLRFEERKEILLREIRTPSLITKTALFEKGNDNKKIYNLTRYQRTNQSTCISERPLLSETFWIEKGDIIADGAASSRGKLSIGQNVIVAYLPWEGYNFEDAILISQRLVDEDIFTSLHIDHYDIEIKNTQHGLEFITNQIPLKIDESARDILKIEKLNSKGLVEIGSWVQEGDYLVGKISPLNPKGPSVEHQYEKLYNVIMQREKTNFRNTSLRVPKGVEGFVLDVQILPSREPDVAALAEKNAILRVRVVLLQRRKIQVGDKMAGRHGNKGIISKIMPRHDMPYLPDGTPVDIVLNPLGVPSRMNVGQILECLLGLAGRYLKENYTTNLFDEKFGAEASRSLVYSKLYEASIKSKNPWLFEPNHPGKIKLFDGRTGIPFDQPITVGCAYILKLVHLVDDKIHARATGPYSAVTQQPVRGRSRNGGQRLGEMEVWALQAYGAAYTLHELLTIKADDVEGRKQAVFQIYANKPLSLGRPESFKVLIRELQALCFDLQLYGTPFQKSYHYILNPMSSQRKETQRLIRPLSLTNLEKLL